MSSQADRILVRRRAGPASGQPASALIEEERGGEKGQQRSSAVSVSLPSRERDGERATERLRLASRKAFFTPPTAGKAHSDRDGPTASLVALLALPSLALRRCVSCVQLLECQFQANSRGERRTVGRTDQPPTAVLSASFGRSLPPRSADFQK